MIHCGSIDHCGGINEIMREMKLSPAQKMMVLMHIYCSEDSCDYELVNVNRSEVEHLISEGVIIYIKTNGGKKLVDSDYFKSKDFSKKQWDRRELFHKHQIQRTPTASSVLGTIVDTYEDTKKVIEWILSKKLSLI